MGGRKKKSHGRKKPHSKKQTEVQRLGSVLHQNGDEVITQDTNVHSFHGMSISSQSSTSKNYSSDENKHVISNNATSETAPSSNRCDFKCKNGIQTDPHSGHGLELAVYDPTFARDQIVQHSGTCVVCNKNKYFMKTCKQCHVMKYCSHKCQREHFKSDGQRAICVRNILFNKARDYISPKMRLDLVMKGYKEISSHLCSIPRREIFQMMDGSRSVILLQVFGVYLNPLTSIAEAVAQDRDGCVTTLHLYPPPGTNNFFQYLFWFINVQVMLPYMTFILLSDAHWNVHADKASAAVDVANLQQIQVIHPTDQILKAVNQQDLDCFSRERFKFAKLLESNVAT
ncbi:hypothetical protein Btru_058866 [Bulinus truncatus]|nr:hypothetical protein Btru_058866 [Bulinus truncatus]